MITKPVNGITSQFKPQAPAPSGTEYKLVDGNSVKIWGENDEEKYIAAKAVADKKNADKASANLKLKNLGLTEDEIKALTGA